MSSKQLGTQGVIKKQMEHVTSTGISGIPNKSAIATNTPTALVLFQLLGVTVTFH